MTKEDEEAACCELCDGAYAWELDQIKKIEPFPVKGQLNLFEVAYGEHQVTSERIVEDAGTRGDTAKGIDAA